MACTESQSIGPRLDAVGSSLSYDVERLAIVPPPRVVSAKAGATLVKPHPGHAHAISTVPTSGQESGVPEHASQAASPRLITRFAIYDHLCNKISKLCDNG
jgi:hypothetical protein